VSIHGVIHFIYHGLLIIGSIVQRILRSVWMFKPPNFCKDWQVWPPAPAKVPAAGVSRSRAVDGDLLGLLIATSIPAGAIVPVLPRGVVLPPGVGPNDPYPISIAFGFQHDVRSELFPSLPGADYLEFAVGVSGLQLATPVDGFSGPCAILGRLDLNELLPIVLGRLLGLQKVLRVANTDDNAFDLRSFWRRSMVSFGSLDRMDEPMRASDCAGLAPLIRTFDQPVVSRSITGALAFTGFTWHWDRGLAQPVRCRTEIVQGFAKGLYVYPPEAGAGAACTGAWQIRVPWTMAAFQDPASFVRR
jgi:hypothetical protein